MVSTKCVQEHPRGHVHPGIDSMTALRALTCAAFLLSPGEAASACGDVPRLRVAAADGTLGPAVFLVSVPEGIRLDTGPYRLESRSGGDPALASVFVDRGQRMIALAIDKLAPGDPQDFQMVPAPLPRERTIEIQSSDGVLDVNTNGMLFARYHSGETKPYWHPVIGPTGAPFTRAYPMAEVEGEPRDHPHQRSLWFTFGDINGVDFWASDPLNKPDSTHGKIVETAREAINGGLVGLVRTTDRWINASGRPVCDDERVFAFWNAGAMRIIDTDVIIRATHGPVTFGDTKEGMLGVRVASELDVTRGQGGLIQNAEGLRDGEAWGKPSAWVDYSGKLAGKEVGLAILNHPESFRYPTPWHVREYGLFAANPFGHHEFGLGQSGSHTLPDGASVRFLHRIVLHEGRAEEAKIAAQQAVYAHPPRVEWFQP